MNKQKMIYYFIGIGGVGMSALARLCLLEENKVFGYDRIHSKVTDELEKEGILIIYEDTVEAMPSEVLDEQTQIIYTSAIKGDHPQLRYFIKNNFSSFFLFCFTLSLTDYLRGKILSGFPWNLWSYSWSWMNELIQILNPIGLYCFNSISIAFFCSPVIFFLIINLNFLFFPFFCLFFSHFTSMDLIR